MEETRIESWMQWYIDGFAAGGKLETLVTRGGCRGLFRFPNGLTSIDYELAYRMNEDVKWKY